MEMSKFSSLVWTFNSLEILDYVVIDSQVKYQPCHILLSAMNVPGLTRYCLENYYSIKHHFNVLGSC